jgi:DNA polymerase-3 subunit epsilon
MLDPERRLTDVDFVAFDLETTGLYPSACRIVEFGALRFRLDGEELGSFDELVNPRCPIPARVSAVHGISDAMVQDKATEVEVLPKYFEFLALPNSILVAHNASFDVGFLSFAAARQGIQLPPAPIIDSLELTRACVRGSRSFRLEDLAIHFRVAESEEHRALSDCRLVMGVLLKVLAPHGRLQNVRDLFRVARPFDAQRARAFVSKPPPGFEALNTAIEEERNVMIAYENASQGVSNRRVSPRAIVRSSGRIYLIAHCHSDRIEKTYRLDRIREYWVLD